MFTTRTPARAVRRSPRARRGGSRTRVDRSRPERLEDRRLLSGFQIPPTYGPPAYIVNMRVADMNDDGHPDLVGVNDYTDGLDVFLNAGDGSFLTPRGFKIADGVATLTVADFTGDGSNDVALGNFYTGDLYLVVGDGRGGFTNAAEGVYSDLTGLPEVAPFAKVDRNIGGLFQADFNNDGRPDLGLVMTTSYPGINDLDLPEVKVFLNQGGGTFAPSAQFRTLYMQRGVVPGDYNGDGLTDLLVVGQTTDYKKGTVGFYAGRGDGTFADAVVTDADANTMPFVTADFNGDGRPDVAYGTWLGDGAGTHGHVAVQLGQGDGTFGPSTDLYDGAGINYVALGDFNADGRPDLAACDYAGNLINVLGNGDGTFQPAHGYIAGSETYRPGVGDFDGDGRSDVAVPDRFLPCGVHIFTAKSDGTLRGVRQFFAVGATLAAAGGDFNGDGHTDVLLGNNWSSGNVAVMLGNADGTFTGGAIYTSALWPSAIALGDLNADGKLDAVVAGTTGDAVSVLVGNGDGTFQTPVSYGAGHYPEGVALADLNGDGKPDLAVASYDGNVRMFAGNGDGTFADPVLIATQGNPSAVSTVDVNHDGRPDLVFSDHWTQGLTLLVNKGDGTFSTQSLILNGQVAHVDTPDLNNDGVRDLVAMLPAQGQVAVLLGLSGGFYAAPRYVATLGPNPKTAGFGDFDGDGHLDMAVLNAGEPHKVAGTMSLLMGDGLGGFRLVSGGRLLVGSNPTGVVTGDFNGDGDVDVAAGNSSGLAVAENTDEATQMEVVPVTLTGKEGVAFTEVVGTLQPFSATLPVSRFVASIQWGDGTSSDAAVTQPGGPGNPYVLTAGHTYRLGGTFTTTVYVHDIVGHDAVTSQSQVTVTPAALTLLNANPSIITAVAGVPTTVVLAHFASASPLAVAADFTATVNWADSGTNIPAAVVDDPKGGFDVVATHTYPADWQPFLDPGAPPFYVSVTVTSKGGATVSAGDGLNLVPYPDPNGLIRAQGLTLSAQAGVPTGPVTVATFTGDVTVDDVWPYLSWAGGNAGERHDAYGTVTQPGGPGTPFVVTANLTFADPGDVNVYVSLIDFNHNAATSATSVVHVAAGQLAATVTTLAVPSPAVVAVGQPLVFAATVTAGDLIPPAGGAVTFRSGTAVLGTAPLDDHGHATLTTATLSVGPYSVTADYAGAGEFAPSPASNAVTVVVNPLAPIAVTGTADVTTVTATLRGTVNPSAALTSVRFAWGETPDVTASGPNLTPPQAAGGGAADVAMTASLTGLTSAHVYYYRVVAANAGGTTVGSVRTFTTTTVPVPQAPTVETLGASSIGSTGAMFEARVNPHGTAAGVRFLYGTDPGLPDATSFRTSTQDVGVGTAEVDVAIAATGLSAGRWYYRALATSDAGTATGSIESLVLLAPVPTSTTTTCTVTPNPAAYGQPVTIRGFVRAGGAALRAEAMVGLPLAAATFTVSVDAGPAHPWTLEATDSRTATTSGVLTGLAAGTHRVVMSYGGNASYAPSEEVETVTVLAPPRTDGPRVVSVTRVESSATHGTIVVTFNEALDPRRATDLANYRLNVASCGQVLRIVAAVYDPARHTVTLRTRGPLPGKYPYRLTVVGSTPHGLTDAQGHPFEGAGVGKAGTDYVTMIPRTVRPAKTVAAVKPAPARVVIHPDSAVPQGPAPVRRARR